jgi:predicted nucleic acid-binding protein
MTAAVFVDTNVFVYARDASEPAKRSIAIQWLEELWREHRGRTSTQVLSEYYVTVTGKLRRRLDREIAWGHVRDLLAWEPQEISHDVLRLAREIEQRYATSWWDAMIVAAAQLQDCSILLSEDFQAGMAFGGVAVRNPFATRVAEQRVEYAAPRVSVARHRPRGRPRSATR